VPAGDHDALEEIVQYHNWHFLIDRYDIPLLAAYATGVCTATNGSTIVTASDAQATWNTGWFNRKILINGVPDEKEIVAITHPAGNWQATLRFPVNTSQTSLASIGYTLYQDEYPIPISPGRDIMIINPTLKFRLIKPDKYTSEDRTSFSRFVGGPGPTMYTDGGSDWNPASPTYGQPRFKFFPTFNSTQTLILYYYKNFIPLSADTDVVPMPQEFDELVIKIATYRLRKTYGIPGWVDDFKMASSLKVLFRENDNTQTAYDYIASLYGYPFFDPYSIDSSLGMWPGKIG
jgi:hypothetical protein